LEIKQYAKQTASIKLPSFLL